MLVGNLCLVAHAMAKQQGKFPVAHLHAVPAAQVQCACLVAQSSWRPRTWGLSLSGSLAPGGSTLLMQDGSAHVDPGHSEGAQEVLKHAEADMRAPTMLRLAIRSLGLSRLT